MGRRRRVLLACAGVLACGALAVAGERTAGDVCLDSESLNSCGASFSSAAGAEIGWTIGQHGLHLSSSDNTCGSVELQSGVWTESGTRFAGTLFLFQ